ncbi:hypothetical protein GCM10009101_03010 [Brevundimonas lenta]
MSAPTSATPETDAAEAVALAEDPALAPGTEKPPAARAGREVCGAEGPEGPVTFMRNDSRTCRTIASGESPFG